MSFIDIKIALCDYLMDQKDKQANNRNITHSIRLIRKQMIIILFFQVLPTLILGVERLLKEVDEKGLFIDIKIALCDYLMDQKDKQANNRNITHSIRLIRKQMIIILFFQVLPTLILGVERLLKEVDEKGLFIDIKIALCDYLMDQKDKQANNRNITHSIRLIRKQMIIILFFQVLPTLILGVERLLKEVDEKGLSASNVYQTEFNPLNFLAQYLMRNNPRWVV